MLRCKSRFDFLSLAPPEGWPTDLQGGRTLQVAPPTTRQANLATTMNKSDATTLSSSLDKTGFPSDLGPATQQFDQ